MEIKTDRDMELIELFVRLQGLYNKIQTLHTSGRLDSTIIKSTNYQLMAAERRIEWLKR